MNELRQTKIEMLEYAAKKIKRENGLICTSITDAKYSNRIKFPKELKEQTERELHRYIRKALRGNTFYSGWVLNKVKEKKYYDISYTQRLRMLKQGRINWINWMIQCLKEDQAREDAE